MKTWHHEFNFEKEVTEIPIFEIEEKPTIHIMKISDYLNENDIKSKLIKRAIEECKLEKNINEQNESQSENFNSGQENILKNYICPNLLQKVKIKYF